MLDSSIHEPLVLILSLCLFSTSLNVLLIFAKKLGLVHLLSILYDYLLVCCLLSINAIQHKLKLRCILFFHNIILTLYCFIYHSPFSLCAFFLQIDLVLQIRNIAVYTNYYKIVHSSLVFQLSVRYLLYFSLDTTTPLLVLNYSMHNCMT